jgi:hypothetical protein
MLKCRAIIAVLIFVGFATLGASQSPNGPSITKENGAAGAGTPDVANPRHKDAASQSPQTATGNKQQSETATDQRKEEKPIEDIEIQRKIAELTKYLVWVGVLQALALGGTLVIVGIQARLMKEHAGHLENLSKAALANAEAAEKSATAAMGIAVPTLILYKFAFVPQRNMFQYDSFLRPKVIVEVKNFGQSPAILKAYILSFSWEDELPEEPVYDFPYPCDAEEVIDPGETHRLDPESTSADRETPLQIAYDLEAGKRRLTVYGYISYGDIFGSPIRYMRFSKRLMEFSTDGSYALMLDHGGEKYTGQREHYDAPNQKWPKAN